MKLPGILVIFFISSSAAFAQTTAAVSVEEVLRLTNVERLNAGLGALDENTLLHAAAHAKLSDMIEQKYFAHLSPAGRSPEENALRTGYRFLFFAENLASGAFGSAGEMLAGWMNSPGHRANILDPRFMEIGIAVGQDETGKVLGVQLFGVPRSACPEPDKSLFRAISQEKERLHRLEQQISEAQHSRLQSSAIDRLIDLHNEAARQVNTQALEYNTQVRGLETCLAAFGNRMEEK